MTLPLRPDTTFSARPVHVSQFPNQSSPYAQYGKRAFDIALVIALTPFVVPLLAVIVLIMTIVGESPFFSQLRLGQNGRVFRIWKLQTMYPDADRLLADLLQRDPARRAEWERTQKLMNDPRITPLGGFLRKTSIDELPQLWNVLKGDMSMIGPRPMMVDQIAIYGPTLRTYLSLRPGISGQWQVTERNEADFSRRAQIDTEYANNMNFTNDLMIVAKTIQAVMRSTGH